MKDKEYHVANFATFVSKTLTFSPQEMDEFSDRLSTASIKCLNWPSPVFGRFQNGCNKVVIEPRVVQFWSEIILVISNRTRAARLFDFEIRHMISAQIALHSVQLPLLIIWANIKRNAPLVVWRGNDKHSTTLYFPSFNTAEWKC